jgi:uncharacterized protein YraI
VAAVLVAMLVSPVVGLAQSCTDCTLYAVTELNLRQDPSLDAPVLRFVPAGAAVHRTTGAAMNGYAPVTYDSVPGWVVALGLVVTPDQVDPEPAPEAPPASDDLRVTLTPLTLRGGPALDAPAVLIMPEGAFVTLTREGAENGYVTVDYDGTTGWAYADLLDRLDE